MPTAIWVWDMQKMSLEAVLEHTLSVRCFLWDPCRPRLALCTGNSKLYLWSPGGCVSVQVPVEGIMLHHLQLEISVYLLRHKKLLVSALCYY